MAAASGSPEEDDLEYYVKFPTPVLHQDNNGGSNGDDDFVFVFQTDKEPVVFLLGWAGCHDVHLAKYSKIYEDRGCITIRYTPPSRYVFFKPERMAPLASRLVELISEMNLEAHPILFHVFSNGGALFYAHVMRVLKDPSSCIGLGNGLGGSGDGPQGGRPLLKVHGAVFDSGPAPRSLTSAFRAITAIINDRQGQVWYAPMVAMVLVFLLSMKHMWSVILGIFWKGSSSSTSLIPIAFSWYEAIRDEASNWPQLFLYSREDKLISYQNVEQLIECRRSQGAKVSSTCFEDSAHVQHLRRHPKLYVDTVHNFLQTCLSEEEEGESKKSV